MRLKAALLVGCLSFALGVPAHAQGPVLLAAWTQVGPHGTLLARAIARLGCPSARVDGATLPMTQRAAPDKSFGVWSCELQLSRGVRTVFVAERRLPLPPSHLRTVAVLADSGCRIELIFFQACNDPAKWPFASVARAIAAAHPDLIVHDGNYYERETACFARGCAGSPHGDNWPTWQTDFFDPAAPMLANAALLAVRGNHEDCARGGAGWDRFLDVFAYGPCTAHEPAYPTTLGGMRFFVLDSSTGVDVQPTRTAVPLYARDFAALRALGPAPTFLLTHRPMWALEGTLTGGTLTINRTLQAAEGNPRTLDVQLVLSGHVHLFEALTFADRRPPQIVVGTGGDTLAGVPLHIDGTSIDGTHVQAGTIHRGFGFAMFHLDEHRLDVYDRSGRKVYACGYAPGTVSCRPS